MLILILIFLISLSLTLIASSILARKIESIGSYFGLSEDSLGLIIALGANAPEISAAVIAIAKHDDTIGIGVILGSNIFNLAAILGASALISGSLLARRQTVYFSGGLSLVATLLILFLALGWVSPLVTLIALSTFFAAYLFVSIRRSTWISPPPIEEHVKPERPSLVQFVWLFLSLTCVVASAYYLLQSTESLGRIWHVSDLILGTLILSAATSLPNAVAAIGLARRGRGSPVVAEAFGSNNLNIFIGIALPSVLIGLGRITPVMKFELIFLLIVTLISVVLLSVKGGLSRLSGTLLAVSYPIFSAIIIYCF